MPSYHSPAEGLSFLELVALVAVAMLASSWAVPRLLGSRVAVNESSAISDIGFVVAAENAYRAAYPQLGYADRLEKLAWRGNRPCRPTPDLACLIDPRLAVGNLVPHDGYYFSLTSGPSSVAPRKTYVVAATAAVPHKDGNHDFCATEDGIVRCLPASPSLAPDSVNWAECRSLPACYY